MMPLLSYKAEVEFALQAVGQAARLARQIQVELAPPALIKEDRSPVTVADYSVQAVLSGRLAQAFPNDPLIAEETSAALQAPSGAGTLAQVHNYVSHILPKATLTDVCDWVDRGQAEPAQRFWTCDPIDGTKGFLRGGQYAVALTLVEAGQVQVGVLGCPRLSDLSQAEPSDPGVLMMAVSGEGAWMTALDEPGALNPIHVSVCQELRQARLVRSYASEHTNVELVDRLAAELGLEAQPLRVDSQVKYALLAAGAAELMLRVMPAGNPTYKEKIWDVAAGALIVQEAGGKVTDLDGNELDFGAGRTLRYNRGVLASNGRLHAAALRALEACRA
jgi:3'(2'), 5'-bisphosphate nucleotidase